MLTPPSCGRSVALTAGSKVRHRLRIAISAYPTCIRCPRYRGCRPNIAVPFGTEKLEWFGYPDGEKNLKISLFVLTQLTNVTDTRTDRHHMTARPGAYDG